MGVERDDESARAWKTSARADAGDASNGAANPSTPREKRVPSRSCSDARRPGFHFFDRPRSTRDRRVRPDPVRSDASDQFPRTGRSGPVPLCRGATWPAPERSRPLLVSFLASHSAPRAVRSRPLRRPPPRCARSAPRRVSRSPPLAASRAPPRARRRPLAPTPTVATVAPPVPPGHSCAGGAARGRSRARGCRGCPSPAARRRWEDPNPVHPVNPDPDKPPRRTPRDDGPPLPPPPPPPPPPPSIVPSSDRRTRTNPRWDACSIASPSARSSRASSARSSRNCSEPGSGPGASTPRSA